MAKKNKLRVLYLQTFPLYGSGSGTFARNLARDVAKHAEVAVVCPDTRKLTGVKLYSFTMPFNVAFTGHPEWPKCKLYSKITSKEILKIHKKFLDSTVKAIELFRPHIIHVHHAFPLSWSARFAKSVYFTPYLITIHGSELPTVQKDKRYHALTMDALRKAVRILPNSGWTKDWTLKVFGEDYRHQMRVIPGGVNVDKFKKVDTSGLDKKYNLTGKKIVVFAGKLTQFKGVKYLVRAAKKIRGEVYIIGDGSEMDNLKKEVLDRKVDNVHFLGNIGKSTDLLIKFYSRADVFIAPSIWDEPLGLVILEAMACETPVVVTRKGGIPLAVKEGKNGLFIKAKSVPDIIEKVNYLLDNPKKAESMGKRARKIAEKKFSWRRISDMHVRLYKRFAKKDRNGINNLVK